MKKFNAFDPILIRIHSEDEWTADFYDRPNYPCNEHYTLTGSIIADKNILPYNEETKHLHGTVGEYTKWVPKKGEPILVRDYNNQKWTLRVFLEMNKEYFMTTDKPDTPNCLSFWLQAKPYTNPFKE
jgi:hypothetical protein